MTFKETCKLYKTEFIVMFVGAFLSCVAFIAGYGQPNPVDKLNTLNSEIESCVWMGGSPRVVFGSGDQVSYVVQCPPRKEYVSMKDCERIESIK